MAQADFGKSIELRNDNRNWAEALYYKSLCLERAGDIQGALDGFNELLDELSKAEKISGKISWTDLLKHRIYVRRKQGYWVAVAEDLKRISSLDAQAKAQLDSLIEKDKFIAAYQLKAVEQVLSSSDSRRIENSFSYFRTGEVTKAIALLSGEVKSDIPSKRILALFLTGYYQASKNSFQEASTNFEAALNQSTEFTLNGLIHFYFSFAKEKLNDLKGAKNEISLSKKIFTSETSLIPSSIIENRMKQLGISQEEAVTAKSSPANTVRVPDEKTETKKEEQKLNAKSEKKLLDNEKKPIAKTENAKILSPIEREISNYTQGLANEPMNLALYLKRGAAFFQANQFSYALIDFNNYVRLSAGQYKGQADLYKAKTYEKLNQIDKAIGVYSEMLKKFSDVDLLTLQTNRKDLYLRRGKLHVLSQNLTAALNDYKKAISLDGQDELLKAKLDSIYASDPLYKILNYDLFDLVKGTLSKRLVEAEAAYREGNLTLCKNIASEEITKENSLLAKMLRGFASMALKEYKQAADDFTSAQASNEINQKGLSAFYLCFIHQKLNNSDEAINQLSEAAKIFTSEKSTIPFSILILQRAELFEKQGFNEEAVKDYDQYLSIRPGDSKVRQRRALIAGKKEEVAQKAPITPPTNAVVNQDQTKTKEPSLRELYVNEKRYALVIGNSDYPQEIGKLINPANDAEDLKTELEKSNFEVTLLKNVTFRQIEVAANNFYKKLSEGPKDNTVGLFYYSGHGLQFEGQNYMVPVDAQVTVPEDVRYVCYPADKLLGKMEFANTRLNIVILDACRSNPFPVAARSSPEGLAQPRAARGSYVAFATAPGSTASDGTGRNGLYTQELLKALQKPELTIEQVFKEVRLNVMKVSGGKQNTWDNSNITGEFYFKFR